MSSSDLLNQSKSNQEENVSNLSYPIELESSLDFHADSFQSIEQSFSNETNRPSQITLINNEEKSTKTSVSSTARLPYSSLFWPRQDQTLDNYIRECDSQTRTDVEKVI